MPRASNSAGPLFRFALRVTPAAWRESVERDLLEDAARQGRRGLRHDIWCACQAAAIAMRLAQHRQTVHIPPSEVAPMRHLGADVRSAWRMFRREPRTTVAIVVALATGIAGVTSVFAVFDYVMFRPVPGVTAPQSIVTIMFQPPGQPKTLGYSASGTMELYRAANAIEAIAPDNSPTLRVALHDAADVEMREVELVSEQLFDVMGVRMAAGRRFTAEESRVEGHQVALVSRLLWRNEFGGDADVLGRPIFVSGHPFTIVGVVDEYRGWNSTRVGTIDIWLPSSAERLVSGSVSDTVTTLMARVRPGTTAEALTAQLRSIHAASIRPAAGEMTFEPTVYPGLRTFSSPGSILELYPAVMGSAALLLLLSCANVANLLLVRLRRRARDLAVRAAIGCSRWRLVRGLLVESAMLALLSAGAGLFGSMAVLQALRGRRVFSTAPTFVDIGIDWRVALFALVVSAFTIVVFSLAPAAAASRADVRPLLQQNTTPGRRSGRLRNALVVVQLAVSVTLLAGAGLMVRTVWNLRSVDIGMRPDGVVSFSFSPRTMQYNAARRDVLVRDVMTELLSRPGVSAVAHASPPAFWASGRFPRHVRLDPQAPTPDVEVETSVVSGSYFETLGIPILSGRTFNDAEFQRRPSPADGPAIISASLATALFGDQPAVGRRIARGSTRVRRGGVMSLTVEDGEFVLERELVVVGVAGDVRTGWSFKETPSHLLYEPGGQQYVVSTMYVRSVRSQGEVVSEVRDVMRRAAPGLPLLTAGTVRDEIERLIPQERLLARVMLMVAVLALLLGLTGVYAVVSADVGSRMREFGIRAALGAGAGDVSRSVLGRALVLCACGASAGIALLITLANVAAPPFFGVTAADPATLSVTATILALATIAASWFPARHAMRVDPTQVLREP